MKVSEEILNHQNLFNFSIYRSSRREHKGTNSNQSIAPVTPGGIKVDYQNGIPGKV